VTTVPCMSSHHGPCTEVNSPGAPKRAHSFCAMCKTVHNASNGPGGPRQVGASHQPMSRAHILAYPARTRTRAVDTE
jgi:hypothetical protein